MGAEPAELAVGQGGGQQTPRQVGVGGVCVCVGGGGGRGGVWTHNDVARHISVQELPCRRSIRSCNGTKRK